MAFISSCFTDDVISEETESFLIRISQFFPFVCSNKSFNESIMNLIRIFPKTGLFLSIRFFSNKKQGITCSEFSHA